MLPLRNVSRPCDGTSESLVLRLTDLDYELPESNIARFAAEPRDSARLLVVSRSRPDWLEHRTVRDLPGYLRPNDLLIVNSSRVLPARLEGERADTGGKVEGLFLAADPNASTHWRVMLRGKRMKPGISVRLFTGEGVASGFSLELLERTDEAGEEGAWRVRVAGGSGELGAAEVLQRVGRTPLPPYIRAARKRHHEAIRDEDDRDRYQAVYAGDASGSVAAPTAGLHFTPALLRTLETKGVRKAEVVLHVGTGTFKPVETEYVEQHAMHEEWCTVPAETGKAIRASRNSNGRIVAVGTTSARTLESFSHDAVERGGECSTRILITPGYTFTNVDVLMTNFHLPRSTLMAMVGALLHSPTHNGVERLKSIYATAIAEGYRFYSFGDAMLVLP